MATNPIAAITSDLCRRDALGIRGTTGGTIKHQAYEAALDLVVHLRRALDSATPQKIAPAGDGSRVWVFGDGPPRLVDGAWWWE